MSAANESMPFTPNSQDYDAFAVWWSRQHPRRWSERRAFVQRIIRVGVLNVLMGLAIVGLHHLIDSRPVPPWQFGLMVGLMLLISVAVAILARRRPSLFTQRWPPVSDPSDQEWAKWMKRSVQMRVTPEGLVWLAEGIRVVA